MKSIFCLGFCLALLRGAIVTYVTKRAGESSLPPKLDSEVESVVKRRIVIINVYDSERHRNWEAVWSIDVRWVRVVVSVRCRDLTEEQNLISDSHFPHWVKLPEQEYVGICH